MRTDEVTPTPRQARVHVPRRDLEQRRADRAAGIGADGLPTARALNISPRQLRRRNPDLTPMEAIFLSRELLTAAHFEIRNRDTS